MRSTNERGYDSRHQAERAKYQRQIDRGATFQCACERDDCTRHDGQCTTIIDRSTRWDLGHTDDRAGWTGPECVPCNRGAGGRNGRAAQQTVDRGWL